jgi:hypothetical protein
MTNRTRDELIEAYRQMAQEEPRELEALEWAEALIGDVADENDAFEYFRHKIHCGVHPVALPPSPEGGGI